MKILLADDDAGYRQSLREILESGDHTVLAVDDGHAAILTYTNNANIDLVITDFNMPGKDGLSVIRDIRKIRPESRVWLVSSAMDDEMKGMAIKAGAEQALWKMEITTELRKWNIIN